MGWQRFRDAEEAREALRIPSGDPRLVARISALWEFSGRLLGAPSGPRGLQRFRTMEEANEQRERWLSERALELRRRRSLG